MGLRGPKPKPKTVATAEGLNLLTELPDPPLKLSEDERAHYDRLGAKLIECGLLTDRDLDVLAQAAIHTAESEALRAIIAAEGWHMRTETGAMKAHPLCNQYNTAGNMRLMCLDRLGMSPEKRTRVKPGKPEVQDEKPDAYFGRKP